MLLLHSWRHLGCLEPLAASSAEGHVPGSAVAASCCAVLLQGAGVFLAGNLLQLVSHWQLAALSRGSKPGIEETAYKVPTGVLLYNAV